MIKLKDKFDFLIVGAGISGCVIAERLASQLNKKIIIVEKRNHIGGNIFDYYNKDGILVHKYGPHIFHTNHDDVWEYLSYFTAWDKFHLKVLAYIQGMKVPFPINLTTVNILLHKNFNEGELKNYFNLVRKNIELIKNAKDEVVSQVGEYFYDIFYKNYSYKQWGVYPDKLLPEVTRRIRLNCSNDDNYFVDKYQGLPRGGYSKLLKQILNHKKITVVLKTDYKQIINKINFDRLIYTGAIDYFLDYKYGVLPYRSLRFVFKTINQEYFQEAAIVNYPNDYKFTRITEFKRLTMQKHSKTTIMREYPVAEGEPYYPIPTEKSKDQYSRYSKETNKMRNVYLIGRLAEYKYYNMDQCVKQALNLFESIRTES